MPHVTYNFSVDTFFAIIIFNIVFTCLHWILFLIHERFKWRWSDWALNIVNFLMTMISVLIANRMPERKQ